MTKLLVSTAAVLLLLSVRFATASECDDCMTQLAHNSDVVSMKCSEPTTAASILSQVTRCTKACSGGIKTQPVSFLGFRLLGCEELILPECEHCVVMHVTTSSRLVNGKLISQCEYLKPNFCESACFGAPDTAAYPPPAYRQAMTAGLATLRHELLSNTECYRDELASTRPQAGRGDDASPQEDIPQECISCVMSIWDPTKAAQSPAAISEYQAGVAELAKLEGSEGLAIPSEVTKEICAKAKVLLDGLTGCLSDKCAGASQLLDEAVESLVDLNGKFCVLDVDGFSQAEKCQTCLKSAKAGIIEALTGSTTADKCELYNTVMDNINECVKDGADCSNGAVDMMVVKDTLQTSVNMFGVDNTCEAKEGNGIVARASELGITLEKQDPVAVEWSVKNDSTGADAGVIAAGSVAGVACVAGMAVIYQRSRRTSGSADYPVATAVDGDDTILAVSGGQSSGNPMFDPQDL